MVEKECLGVAWELCDDVGISWREGDVAVKMRDAKGEGGLKIKSTKPSVTERMTRDRFLRVLRASGRSGRLSLHQLS
jgi:hypothetical protein